MSDMFPDTSMDWDTTAEKPWQDSSVPPQVKTSEDKQDPHIPFLLNKSDQRLRSWRGSARFSWSQDSRASWTPASVETSCLQITLSRPRHSMKLVIPITISRRSSFLLLHTMDQIYPPDKKGNSTDPGRLCGGFQGKGHLQDRNRCYVRYLGNINPNSTFQSFPTVYVDTPDLSAILLAVVEKTRHQVSKVLHDKADEDNCMIQAWSSMVEGHFKSINKASADLIVQGQKIKIFQESWTLGTRDSLRGRGSFVWLAVQAKYKREKGASQGHWPP